MTDIEILESTYFDKCTIKRKDKVVSIMKPLVTGGTQNTGEIKSITRGDTKIEYNVGEAVVSTSNGATLTSSDKEFLKQYRRARCY